MNRDIKIGSIIIFLGILIIGVIVLFSSSLDSKTRIVDCVDGNRNINLDGLQCVETYSTVNDSEILADIIFFIYFLGSFFSVMMIMAGAAIIFGRNTNER